MLDANNSSIGRFDGSFLGHSLTIFSLFFSL